jgi:hypothetical protein
LYDKDQNLYWDGRIRDSNGNIRNYDINNLPDEEIKDMKKYGLIR